MLITIDGPAGAGKSTVARRLAQVLTERTSKTFEYLDTGSMYRAVALFGLRHRVDWQKPEELEMLASEAVIDIESGRTLLDGEDVTDAVRSPEVTKQTRFAADNPRIRRLMVEHQRVIARRFVERGEGVVTEGRDQGTVVFPDAPCKFFVTATPEERTRRRCGELRQRGESPDFDNILEDINLRDRRDSSRQVGPLRKPDDAAEIVTDGMDADAVVEELVRVVEKFHFQAASSREM